jgi:ribosomal protein S18 acetylase RimI-like enzyme
MTVIPIKTARTREKEQVVRTITESFRADPAARWIYPATEQYDNWFPSFVAAFAGKAFEHRSACCAADYAGAALWLPPGVHPDETALLSLVRASVGAGEQDAVLALFEQMDRHHPAEPHWYLPMIGVAPVKQGSGVGSALLNESLRRCDAESRLAYLEATTTQSVRLYERHGFAVSATIQAGSAPPLYAMVRRPQPDRKRPAGESAPVPG